MNLPLFIARRYLFAHKSRNVIHVMAGVSAAGIAIGAMASILILSIFNGFDQIIERSLEDLDADLRIVRADGGKSFYPSGRLLDALASDPRVKSCTEVLEDHIFFTYGEQQGIALAKGIDEAEEERCALSEHIVAGSFRLHHGDVPMVCIGSGLAASHQIRPHFTTALQLYYPDRSGRISLSRPEASLESVRTLPAGVFSINSTADANLMVLPLATMRRLLKSQPQADEAQEESEECSYLEVRLHRNGKREVRRFIRDWSSYLAAESGIAGNAAPLQETGSQQQAVLQMQDRVSQNPSIYKMMRYEKLSVYLVLIFVVCIIAFNIYGSQSMLIIEKQADIETLRALGCAESRIRRAFVWEGWLIALLGLAAGLLLGIGAALLQQETGLIKMPGNFILNAYPVVLQGSDLLLTAVTIAAIGLGIAWLAALKVTHFHSKAA